MYAKNKNEKKKDVCTETVFEDTMLLKFWTLKTFFLFCWLNVSNTYKARGKVATMQPAYRYIHTYLYIVFESQRDNEYKGGEIDS